MNVRFDGRNAVPRVLHVAVETDNKVETLHFDLPEIGENQEAMLYYSQGGKGDAITITDGDAVITNMMTQLTGDIQAYVRITADGDKQWNSVPFTISIKGLPNTEEIIDQMYPSAIQQGIDEVNALVKKAEDKVDEIRSVDATATVGVGTDTPSVRVTKTEQDHNVKFNFAFNGLKGAAGRDGVSPSATVNKTADGAVISITDANGTTTTEIKDGAAGEKGDDGKDGVSPIAIVEEVTGGVRLTVNDAHGETSAIIKNGNDGSKGETGEDGYSPSAKVSSISGGVRISITDKKGTTTANVFDGRNGIDGRDGRDGHDGYTPVKGVDYFDGEDGKDGHDGYTPVKGVDYFDGKDGKDGSDANVTKENIESALGFTPADEEKVPTKEDLSALASRVVEYKNVTINVKDTEGNPVVGSGTVVVSDGNGNTYSTISYSGNAVVQRLPIGFSYSITVNDDIDEYYSPDVIVGVVTANATITVTLHKIGVISSFADIQYLVQHGIADRVFSIGDQIHVNYTYNGTVYDCPFDVVAFENVTLKDGSVVPGMYLQQHFATIESIPINNAEQTIATEATAQAGWYYYGFTSSSVEPVLLNLKTGDAIDYSAYPSIYKSSIRDTTGNIARYGYNNYAKSIYREWLNSDKAAGQWHTAQYPSQPIPSQVNQYRGYIAGLDPEFIAIVGETEQKVALNTVTDGGEIVSIYDKFFPPSLEQLYGAPQVVGVEGSYWPYWENTLELNAPSNAANEKRKVMALDAQTSVQTCRLRSATRGYSSTVWSVHASTGELYGGNANTALRCAPACVIC